MFLPIIGLVPHEELTPGDLVGLNKDSFLIVEKIPAEYDSRVKAMEIDEKPTEDYLDVGGLSKQIEEMREAVVIPMLQKDMFIELGIKPPKGVLLYGEPGTGKTLLARACAAQTEACFLKLAGPQLVQMFIGDGAKIVRDAFALAREKVSVREQASWAATNTHAQPHSHMHVWNQGLGVTRFCDVEKMDWSSPVGGIGPLGGFLFHWECRAWSCCDYHTHSAMLVLAPLFRG